MPIELITSTNDVNLSFKNRGISLSHSRPLSFILKKLMKSHSLTFWIYLHHQFNLFSHVDLDCYFNVFYVLENK